MITRSASSSGVRWSSYVGDVRCFTSTTAAANSTTTSPTSRTTTTSASAAPHERLLILGSGVAGCAAALTAARHGIHVTILHAGSSRNDCNSYWAQGGIIYRNYRHRNEESSKENSTPASASSSSGGGEELVGLVDTPKSLVEDIRIASGYTGPLKRTDELEEGYYSSKYHLDNNDMKKKNTNNGDNSSQQHANQLCTTSNVRWSEDASWKLATEGPMRIRQLLLGPKDYGSAHIHYGQHAVVPFDRQSLPSSTKNDDGYESDCKDGSEDDVLSLCLEASHSSARIIHYADCTGKVITECVTEAASKHPLIEFRGDCVVTDLIFDEDGNSGSGSSNDNNGMVIGAQVLDKKLNQQHNMYATHGVVLASGGLGGIYQHSTNPLGFNALGSSVGLALRLEDRMSSSSSSSPLIKYNGIVSDLEYVQFHPTSLYIPGEARFLLTEALRGEGAVLRDASGRAFARDYHPNGELAPRDIVARAVFMESQKSSDDGVHNAYLDISHRDNKWLTDRFPSIHAHLKSRSNPLDFTKDKIPVIPAAHYTCGGVTTDLNGCVIGSNGQWYGNLYAAGEAARTGLHGGNRLASTSLLEGLVYGASVGEMVAGVVNDVSDDKALENRERSMEMMHQARYAIEQRLEQSSSSSSSSSSTPDDAVRKEATAILTNLKSIMWDNVGVVRTPSKLELAVSELNAIRTEADTLWNNGDGGAGWEVVALRDAAHSGLAVAECALANRVSGGAHYVVLEEETESESSDEEEPIIVGL
jgi:L-aspartate oxidase